MYTVGNSRFVIQFHVYVVVENGGWSEWTPWSSCHLAQCGHQMEKRKRLCDNPAAQAAGNYCRGQNEEEVVCSEGDPPACKKGKARLVVL